MRKMKRGGDVQARRKHKNCRPCLFDILLLLAGGNGEDKNHFILKGVFIMVRVELDRL
jgi:hypothetical protein